jgi:hypothetical protein
MFGKISIRIKKGGMQDDSVKRTTVEDQELSDMIANLNGAGPTSSPAGAAAPPPVSPTPPAPPPVAPVPDLSSLPPLPDPAVPVSNPAPPLPDPTPASLPSENSNFNIPEPTPGLPPLPTAGTPLPPLPSDPTPPPASTPEQFEPPASTLPPLGHKTPLPPLPNEFDDDPDSDIDEIAADFPEPSVKVRKPILPKTRDNTDLSSIKQEALDKLRPLVDELDLPAQEKFDTLLLLIRSNDDKTLIPQAYQAAADIADETARAAALLDIVKEIDYFENPN